MKKYIHKLLITSLIIISMMGTNVYARGDSAGTPEFIYNGRTLTIPCPTGYDTSVMTYLGIRVSRYESTIPNDSNNSNYTKKLSLGNGSNNKDSWFIPVATQSDDSPTGRVFNLNYDNDNVHKYIFSGFHEEDKYGLTGSNFTQGNTIFKVVVEHLFKLANGTDIVGGVKQVYIQISPAIISITSNQNGLLANSGESLFLKVRFSQPVVVENTEALRLKINGGNEAPLSQNCKNNMSSSGLQELEFELKDINLKEVANLNVIDTSGVMYGSDVHAINTQGGVQVKAWLGAPSGFDLRKTNEIAIDCRKDMNEDLSWDDLPTSKYVKLIDVMFNKGMHKSNGFDFPNSIISGVNWTNQPFSPKYEIRNDFGGVEKFNLGLREKTGIIINKKEYNVANRDKITYNPGVSFVNAPNLKQLKKKEIGINTNISINVNEAPNKQTQTINTTNIDIPNAICREVEFVLEVNMFERKGIYTKKLGIDTVSPEKTLFKFDASSATLKFDVADNGCGVEMVEYCMYTDKVKFDSISDFSNYDGSAPKIKKNLTEPDVISNKLVKYFKYRVYDKLGNVTPILKGVLDETPPIKAPRITYKGVNVLQKMDETITSGMTFINPNIDKIVKFETDPGDDDCGLSSVKYKTEFKSVVSGGYSEGRTTESYKSILAKYAGKGFFADKTKAPNVDNLNTDLPSMASLSLSGGVGATEINSQDGYMIITASSVDFGENMSPLVTTIMGVDKTKPVINNATNSSYKTGTNFVKFKINSSDNFSGIRKVKYEVYSKNSGALMTSGELTTKVITTTEEVELIIDLKGAQTTGGDFRLNLKAVDASGNESDSYVASIMENFIPEIKIEEPPTDLLLSSKDFITIKGKVKDKNVGQGLNLTGRFGRDSATCVKLNNLNMTANGDWQDFSFMLTTREFIDGTYPLVEVQVTDDLGERALDNFKNSKIIIDKKPPEVITKLPLMNQIASENKIILDFEARDIGSGIDTFATEINGLKTKNIPISTDIKTLPEGVYNIGNNGDTTVRFVIVKENVTDPTFKMIASIYDKAGNVEELTQEILNIPAHKLSDIILTLKNFNEDLPICTRTVHTDNSESTVMYVTKKPATLFTLFKSYKFKEGIIEATHNGKPILTERVNSPNYINREINLNVQLDDGDNIIVCTIRDLSGNIVKTNRYQILIVKELPLKINISNFKLLVNDKDFEYDTDVYYGDSMRNVLTSEGAPNDLARNINTTSTIPATGVVTIQYRNKMNEVIMYQYNLINTKSTLEVTEDKGKIGFKLSLFGITYDQDSSELRSLITSCKYMNLKRDSSTEKYFVNDKLIENITRYGTTMSAVYSEGFKLPGDGEYASMVTLSLLNFKNLTSVSSTSFIGDENILLPVEYSKKFKYNESIIYDGVKVKNHNLGSTTQGMYYNNNVILYSSMGLKIYLNDLTEIVSKSTKINSLKILGTKVYIFTDSEVLSLEDSIIKQELNEGFDFAEVVDGNLLATKGNRLYNLSTTDKLITTVYKDLGSISKVVGIYRGDENTLSVVDSTCKVINILQQ